MNRYASGYALIQVLSVVGWLVIALSMIGAIIVASNAPRDMGWVGFVVFIAGGFQGLMLIGVGAIGSAVLDGATSQARSVELQEKFFNAYKSFCGDSGSRLGGTRDNNQLEKPSPSAEEEEFRKKLREDLQDDDGSLELKTSYYGYNIRINSHGFCVGRRVFGSVLEAYHAIDAVNK